MYYNNAIYREDLDNAIHSVNGYQQLKGKKILITGATGMLGAFVIDMFLYINSIENLNIDIWAMGRSEEKLRHRFASNISSENLHFLIQDVTEPLLFTEKVDYIFHFAGDGYPSAFVNHPVETMTPAFVGTYNLLQFASNLEGCRFMLASTGEVYGIINDKELITENDSGYVDPTSVRACYPSAKRAAESLCVSFAHEYFVDAVIARFSHVYGGCFSDKDNRATAQFMRNAIRGDDIVLFSKGEQKRSYTYVVDAIIGAMTIMINGEKGHAYNVANKNSRVTIAEFAGLVANICGVNIKYDIIEKTGNSPITFAVLDSSKIEKIGYQGIYSLEDGIARAIRIMRG